MHACVSLFLHVSICLCAMRRRVSVYAQEYEMSRQVMHACQHSNGLYVTLAYEMSRQVMHACQHSNGLYVTLAFSL